MHELVRELRLGFGKLAKLDGGHPQKCGGMFVVLASHTLFNGLAC